jgi:hypothetical protein
VEDVIFEKKTDFYLPNNLEEFFSNFCKHYKMDFIDLESEIFLQIQTIGCLKVGILNIKS